jgi:glycosyltransferase involved in cell wall biosynthesis
VESALNQDFTLAKYEVIVVNDTGRPLPDADWQHHERVRIVMTNKRERCVARNTGAAIANGQYFHFLDDDDWLLPGAYQVFWNLVQQSPEALWLYGGAQLVNRQGENLIELHHNMFGNCFMQIMAGEWIPLQTSLIKAKAFFTIGGFHPLMLVSQDVDICRRIALIGEMAEAQELVACVGMGEEGSSTNYELASTYSRWAREHILEKQGVFNRMLQSSYSSYWRGRMVIAYLTSAVWNIQHQKFLTAFSRLLISFLSLAVAGKHLFSPSFWRAIANHYQSPSFFRGFELAEQVK